MKPAAMKREAVENELLSRDSIHIAKANETEAENPSHSFFGGSAAARVLACPAFVGLVQKVPAHLRRTSSYAERGTALHTAMALLIEEKRRIDDLVGETIGGYAITADDIEIALKPVYAFVAPLLDADDAAFYLEQRVAFPGVPTAFGTADLIIRNGTALRIIDCKFGALPVRALYPDPDDDGADILNPQLMYYAAAARYTLPSFFAGVDEIVLSIVQPVSLEPDADMVSSVVVTPEELDDFITAYRAACEEALTSAPRMRRGSHCRFCPARPICPEHTGPLLDLSQFVVPTPTAPPSKEPYLQLLADGLSLVDLVKDISAALRDQAKRALENGAIVPGYELSAGRAERHWHDEGAAISALIDLGLARSDVIAETVRSPKQVELRAKARGLKVPTELIDSRRSGVSLVRRENARAPVAARSEIARSFSAALEAFQKGAL
jgi:hypothetical protein